MHACTPHTVEGFPNQIPWGEAVAVEGTMARLVNWRTKLANRCYLAYPSSRHTLAQDTPCVGPVESCCNRHPQCPRLSLLFDTSTCE